MYRRHDECALFLDEGFGHKELAPELEKLNYTINLPPEIPLKKTRRRGRGVDSSLRLKEMALGHDGQEHGASSS